MFFEPSGQSLPVVTWAMRSHSTKVLPQSGLPVRRVILPTGILSGHSHSNAFGFMSVALYPRREWMSPSVLVTWCNVCNVAGGAEVGIMVALFAMSFSLWHTSHKSSGFRAPGAYRCAQPMQGRHCSRSNFSRRHLTQRSLESLGK